MDRKTGFRGHKDIKNIFSAWFSGDIKKKRIYFLLIFQRTQRHVFLDIKTERTYLRVLFFYNKTEGMN